MSQKAQGSRIGYSSALSPTIFTNVTKVTNINMGGASRSEIDKTDLDSVAMEYESGLVDYGNITFDVNYKPEEVTHQQLDTLFASGETRNWRITGSDASPKQTATVAGYLSSFTKQYAVNALIKAQVTIRCTGALTIA